MTSFLSTTVWPTTCGISSSWWIWRWRNGLYIITIITSLILHTPQSMPFCTSTTTTATPMSLSQVLNVYTFSIFLTHQKWTIPNGCHNVSRPPYIDASRMPQQPWWSHFPMGSNHLGRRKQSYNHAYSLNGEAPSTSFSHELIVQVVASLAESLMNSDSDRPLYRKEINDFAFWGCFGIVT